MDAAVRKLFSLGGAGLTASNVELLDFPAIRRDLPHRRVR